ncbi:MAG: hypothetical protein GY946_34240 [bacterium]|nr:hypothetical protein [bacterium]
MDTEKTGGADEADPYVLAYAVLLAGTGAKVTVVTEERTSRPDKLAMTDAAGILELPAMSLDAYLRLHDLY